MYLRYKLLLLLALSISNLTGCGDSGASAAKSETANSSVSGTKSPAGDGAPASSAGEKSAQEKDAAKNAPAVLDHSSGMKLATQLIAKQDFDAAQKQLDELDRQVASLTEADKKQLADIKEKFEEQRQLLEDQSREKQLAAAKLAVKEGKLDDAATAIETLLAAAPTTEQGAAARELQTMIERHRTVRRRLRVGMEQLASKERGSVKKAAEILWEEQEVALPLLLESLHSDNSVLVSNTLELLRKFNQPDRTLPGMIAILGREKQAEVWPVAIKELQKVQSPGAGKPLLELALAAPAPERAIPALTALSGASDPPPETLVMLLPKIYVDSPALAAALSAAYRAITVNHQHDVLTRRGVEIEVTAAQDAQLTGLGDRLQAIIAAAAKRPELAEAAWSAQRLAIAMRMMSAQTLPGVKVVRATADSPDSPAAAVLDGVWNSVDVKTMWLHPSKRLTTIVLDLGAERTVSGIRIWNCNEVSGTHRGWKEVEIYVSSDTSPTVPAAIGVVPPAPGAAGTPDYGAILQVPFAKGRFVKLQLLGVWREDGIAGLSELQVLGY
ncbi:MAG: hypothetical protein JWM11_4049 [Planctomycetaceae bacterium]|nr:hypothetical protein [Planctomycetaceae bacterium]